MPGRPRGRSMNKGPGSHSSWAPMRPRSLKTEEEVFRWFMPGDPPEGGCWDWVSVMRGKYGAFSLNNKLVSAHHASHRIFIGPIPPGMYVLHSCDRPICVHPSHLRAGTPRENMEDRSRRGRAPKGQDGGNAKLNPIQVMWIRGQQGKMSHSAIAEVVGISKPTVTAILNGRIWRHL